MNHAVEARVLRTIGLLFGVAGAVYGLLDLGNLLQQLDDTPPTWTVLAVLATVGLPIALGVAAPRSGIHMIRALAAAVAAGSLLALATVSLVFSGSAPADASPWVLQLTGLGTTGAALGLPIGFVVVDVLLTGVLVTVDRIATSSIDLTPIPLQDGAYAALFSAIFAALAIGRSAWADRWTPPVTRRSKPLGPPATSASARTNAPGSMRWCTTTCSRRCSSPHAAHRRAPPSPPMRRTPCGGWNASRTPG